MADTTIAFYGVKFEMGDLDLDLLESRIHPFQIAAKRFGLDSYWGNFEGPNERFLLFVGRLLGKLGFEDRMEIQMTPDELMNVVQTVTAKLRDAGISDAAMLHLDFQPDP
jgi:hypothetical protein